MKDYNDVNIRFSHPNLYRLLVTFSIIHIGLGLNFLLAKPAFNPYGINVYIIGVIFLSLGLSKLFFLMFRRNLRVVRIVMALSIGFTLFWGFGTIFSFLRGQTSLQMFVLYVGLAVIEMSLLLEPLVNPITEKVDVTAVPKEEVKNVT